MKIYVGNDNFNSDLVYDKEIYSEWKLSTVTKQGFVMGMNKEYYTVLTLL